MVLPHKEIISALPEGLPQLFGYLPFSSNSELEKENHYI